MSTIYQYLRECALARAAQFINRSAKRRFVSGIAISTDQPTGGGQALKVAERFVMPQLPIPLCISHQAHADYGLVTKLAKNGKALAFEAELYNRDPREWTEDPWGCLLLRELTGVSVTAVPAEDYGFTISEVSLTPSPKDRGAKVSRCWTVDPVVRLGAAPGASMRVLWSSAR